MSESKTQVRLFLLFAILLLAYRFFHLEPFIGNPHGWRQSDTAYYIYDFYKNGIDLFRPSVCWMGGHETLIFEFPLPEAIVALFYRLGGEYLILARLVFLCFFLLSAMYCFRLSKWFAGPEIARRATLIFMALPLSLYYSRAIHIDFFATACAFAMVFHWLQGIDNQSRIQLFYGSLAASLALLVKAPYAFVFGPLLLVFALKRERFSFAFRQMYFFLLPVIIFYFWQKHSLAVNGSAPDWDFIAQYRKFDNNSHWYYGNWYQRKELENWITVKNVIFREAMGWIGFIILILGSLSYVIRKQVLEKESNPNQFSDEQKAISFPKVMLCLWIGFVIYVCVFFNLNIIHEYYQIPVLLPMALSLAWGIYQLEKWLSSKTLSIGLMILLIGAISFESIRYAEAEANYYDFTDHEPLIEAGQILQEETNPEDLLVVNYYSFDCRNPLVLYRARRRGWQIPIHGFDAATIYRLKEEARASRLVILAPQAPVGEIERFTDVLKNPRQFQLQSRPLTLYLWDLEMDEQLIPSSD